MVVSRQLLALMSISPVTAKPALVTFHMDFRYPFPWKTVSSFVLMEKKKGPPDDAVNLEVDGSIYRYTVMMPWYARLLLSKTVVWDDIVSIDNEKQVLAEWGTNTSHRKMGSVVDSSVWSASESDPAITLYKKQVDFNVNIPIGPTIALKVASPLIKWFKTKSALCRQIEVDAMRAYFNEDGSQPGLGNAGLVPT
ncbi:unnamed protein product [Choristocarpus tenellus]